MRFAVILVTYCFLVLVSSCEGKKNGVMVTGDCEKRILPDRVAINIGVETIKDSVDQSTAEANSRYNALVERLKELNLKDAAFSTSKYSTSPYRVWEKEEQKLKGYRTQIELKIETSEISRAGEVIKIAGNLGMEQIEGPRPFVSNSLYKRSYQDCLQVASEDAQKKASILAKSLGVTLGQAYRVNEKASRNEGQRPVHYMNMAKSADASQTPRIEYEKEKIVLELEVAFETN